MGHGWTWNEFKCPRDGAEYRLISSIQPQTGQMPYTKGEDQKGSGLRWN